MQQYAKYREKEQLFKIYFILRRYVVYDVILLLIKLYHRLETSIYNNIRVNSTEYTPKQLLCIEYTKYSEKDILINYINQSTNLHVFHKTIYSRPPELSVVIISSSNFFIIEQQQLLLLKLHLVNFMQYVKKIKNTTLI